MEERRSRGWIESKGEQHPDRRRFLMNTLLGGSVLAGGPYPFLEAAPPRGVSPGKPDSPGRLHKIRDLDLYRKAEYYCGPGPSAAVFPDGEIVLGFRRAPAGAKTHMYLETEGCVMTSSDGGNSWSEPWVIDYGGVHNVNLTLLRDGTLLYATSIVDTITRGAYERAKDDPRNLTETGARRLVFNADDWGRGLGEVFGREFCALEAGVCVRRSTDRGRSWSPRFWVSPIPGTPALLPGFPAPVELRSPVVQLRSGALVFPVYGFPTPWRVVLMGSNDGGLTWTLLGEIAGPSNPVPYPQTGVGPNETVVEETPSGRLVAFIRHEGNLLTSRSQDGGRTWSPPRHHELWGYPYTTVRMPSGRVLLAYGYRREPYGIRARLLDAECEKIDEAPELVVRDDGGQRDLGYPLGTLLTDGRVFLTYYFNQKVDQGRQVYVAASILSES